MIDRRKFLKASGIAVALPWLESIGSVAGFAGTASAAGPAVKTAAAKTAASGAPLRYVNVYFATGFPGKGDGWMCSGKGDSFKLGPWLKSLEPFKNQITQVRNLRYDCGPHTRFGNYLSGYPLGLEHSDDRLPMGAPYSVDQVIADEWAGQGAEMHSFVLGSDIATKPDPKQMAISYRVGAAVPRFVSPSEAFDALFNGPEERRRDRSVLDLVREQARTLENEVSASDRHRLDQYQTSIRELERRIEDAEKPRPADAWKPSLLEPDMDRPDGVPPHLPDYHRLMLEIALLSLKMDKARVVTLMLANESSGFRYNFLGDGVNGGLHDISHGAGGGDRSHAKIVEYFADQFGAFVKGCAEVDEGEGNLLDHTLIQYGSCMADGGGHHPRDIPQILVGGAHGRHKGGRIITMPEDTPIGHASLGVMQMLGIEKEKFGMASKPVSF